MAARIDLGQIREHNEDNYLLNPDLNKQDWFATFNLTYTPSSRGGLMMIADGMGGMNAGEVASKIAIEQARDYFAALPEVPADEVKNTLKRVFKIVNDAIAEHARLYPETEGMGTTLVIAWIRDEAVHIAWVGDSRAYLFRPTQGLRRLSKDHSLVQQWVDENKLTDEQAFYHPQSNIVTQSLGDPGRDPAPDYSSELLEPGDLVMLCSDGLCSMIQDVDIEKHIRENRGANLAELTSILSDAANAAGGYDNISITLADIREANGVALPEQKPTIGRDLWAERRGRVITWAVISVAIAAIIYLTAILGKDVILGASNSQSSKRDSVSSIQSQTGVITPDSVHHYQNDPVDVAKNIDNGASHDRIVNPPPSDDAPYTPEKSKEECLALFIEVYKEENKYGIRCRQNNIIMVKPIYDSLAQNFQNNYAILCYKGTPSKCFKVFTDGREEELDIRLTPLLRLGY